MEAQFIEPIALSALQTWGGRNNLPFKVGRVRLGNQKASGYDYISIGVSNCLSQARRSREVLHRIAIIFCSPWEGNVPTAFRNPIYIVLGWIKQPDPVVKSYKNQPRMCWSPVPPKGVSGRSIKCPNTKNPSKMAQWHKKGAAGS